MRKGRNYSSDRSKIRKDANVCVSVSPDEKRQLEQDAGALGLTNSAYIRFLWLTHREEHLR